MEIEGKIVPDGKASKCKDPEAGMCLAGLKSMKCPVWLDWISMAGRERS